MADLYKYDECPSCGSTDKNRYIYKCTACGEFYGCWDEYNSGCWKTGTACPNAKCKQTGKYERVGYIKGG